MELEEDPALGVDNRDGSLQRQQETHPVDGVRVIEVRDQALALRILPFDLAEVEEVVVLARGLKAEADVLLADGDGKVHLVDQVVREHLGDIVRNEKSSLVRFGGEADRIEGVLGQPPRVRCDHLALAFFGEEEEAPVEDVPVCVLLRGK